MSGWRENVGEEGEKCSRREDGIHAGREGSRHSDYMFIASSGLEITFTDSLCGYREGKDRQSVGENNVTTHTKCTKYMAVDMTASSIRLNENKTASKHQVYILVYKSEHHSTHIAFAHIRQCSVAIQMAHFDLT